MRQRGPFLHIHMCLRRECPYEMGFCAIAQNQLLSKAFSQRLYLVATRDIVSAVERSILTFARLYHKQGEMCKCFEGPYTLVKKPVLYVFVKPGQVERNRKKLQNLKKSVCMYFGRYLLKYQSTKIYFK